MLFSKAIGALICVHLVIATTFPSIDPELRPSVPSTTPVSSVDTSLTTYDRIVLKVGDEPFFYNGVQIRVDKLQDIWNRTDSDNQQLFVDAANFGFTVINTQVRWMDIQPDASYNATESTYVQGGASANVNFSKNSTLRIAHASSAGDQAVSFIKFDFTPYDRANISGAKVRVYVDRWSDNNATFPATLVGLTDNSWDASSATWNNGAPNWNSGNFAGSNGSDWFALASSPSWDLIHSPAYYDFDVSDFIANHCPDKVATFAVLAQPNATVSAVGASIDGASGSVPPSLTLSDETHFQWDYVDKLMSWSQQAGIKFEPIWFGSDTTSETIDNRVPYFLLRNIKNEQVTSDGSHRPVLIKNDPFKSRGLGVYQFLMDKNDPKTRRQEYTAINAMMEHISEWDKANGNQKTVIGVDVANEPAVSLLHGGQFTPWQNPVTWGRLSEFPSVQAFVNRTAWEFTNNLANAVKDSSYPVWTRSNDYQGADAPGVWYNELMRENGGTSLDFIGIDPYSNDTERSFAVGHDVFFYNGTGKNLKQEFAIGRNLPMIMENAGYYNNSDKLYGPDAFGLLIPKNATGGDYAPVWRGPYVQTVIDTNNALKQIGEILASTRTTGSGGTRLGFLNKFANSTTETIDLHGVTIKFDSSSYGVGIASVRSDTEFVVLSTGGGSFEITGIDGTRIRSVEKGYYRGSDWIANDTVGYSSTASGLSFGIDAYSVVKVCLDS